MTFYLSSFLLNTYLINRIIPAHFDPTCKLKVEMTPKATKG